MAENMDFTPSQSPAGGTDRGLEGHPCRGCFHWRGGHWKSVSCNYLFDTGHRRPCEPGEHCTVRRERGKSEWEQIREMQRLK